jgi:hypothetical protein
MADDSLFSRVTSIAALVRDVGVIIGLPVILTVGIKLYERQNPLFLNHILPEAASLVGLSSFPLRLLGGANASAGR